MTTVRDVFDFIRSIPERRRFTGLRLPDTAAVAHAGGRIVGAAYANLDGGHAVVGVAVLPAYRRRGIAFALADRLLKRLRGRADFAVWRVDADNLPSINLALSLGGEVVSRGRQWYIKLEIGSRKP